MHKTCTGTKKTDVLKFKVHQTCTGTKKTKVLNFKVHQTCTGTKKTKTSQSTWEGATIPLKFLFFCFFCPCAGLVHFEVQNFCFFCPCAGLVHFEVQNFDIVCPCAGFRQGVGLQSPPNLQRDKKNTSFELQTAPNLHRDKKTRVLNFKVHQTCTGTKNKKKKLHNLLGKGRLSL